VTRYVSKFVQLGRRFLAIGSGAIEALTRVPRLNLAIYRASPNLASHIKIFP